MTDMGVCLALQTENPLALEASNRRNVTNEEIKSAIAWAKGLNLTTSTDLIFGLPLETRDTFVKLLNRTVERGFDDVVVQNLVLMDGIEMNRPDFRKKYNIKTKYRFLSTHYCMHNDTFVAEHEEVVTSSNTFSYDDFLEIRNLNFMFYSVFNLNFQKWFFQFVRHLKVDPSRFFSSFVKPDRSINWPDGYLRFLDDLKAAIEGELHDTREEMVAKAKKIFVANGNNVGDQKARINMNFGARLNYLENSWVKPVLMYHLDKIMGSNLSGQDRDLAGSLINLATHERINLKHDDKKEPLHISFDIINWKKNKFNEPLHNFKMLV